MTSDRNLEQADDAVIGQAFRLSLIAFAGLAAVGGSVFWWMNRTEEQAAPTESHVNAPQVETRTAEAPTVAFTDVTTAAGIAFDRTNGATGEKFLPETMGGGVAFLDFDGDGDQDLFFANGRSWEAGEGTATQRLYANDGTGQFSDVTAAAGLDLSLQAMGVAAADWDGDGDTDLYLSGIGTDRLLRNDDGHFVDVTAESGITSDPERWGSSAAFFDLDRDGDLDLFVGSYVRWSPAIDREIDYQLTGVGRAYGPPTNYPGDHSRLFENTGDGRFVDISDAAGIRIENEATGVPVGKTLGVSPVDIDGDGWVDLAIANDTVRNFLFRNRGDRTFEEIGVEAGLAFDRNGMATGAMGIDASAYRGDGCLAFAVGNFANEMSSLYVARQGRAFFTDESIVDGVGAPSRKYLSFGVLFLDYDQDGRMDLLQVNGHLEDEIQRVQPSQRYEQPPQLFWNAGPEARSTFQEVAPDRAGDLLARPVVGRACAAADIDADGDLDIVVTQSRGPALLFRNDTELAHHWLAVRLEGTRSNPQGLGAVVSLELEGGTLHQTIQSARGYLTSVPPIAHFGLGQAVQIQSLTVTWPNGTTQSIAPPAVDQMVVVRQGRVSTSPNPAVPPIRQ